MIDRNVGLTTTFALVKVSANMEEDEPLSQTQVGMTSTKKTKHVLSVLPKTVKG